MPSNSADRAPADVSESLATTLLRFGVRAGLKPVLSRRVPISWQRRWLRLLAQLTSRSGGVEIQAGELGGTRGEWLRVNRPAATINRTAAILYLHGGAYCVGAPNTHRAVTSSLARAAELPVFAVDYRLAPEHPFPAAFDDTVAAYRSLIELGPVVIVGDSAGAGLALATALAARQQHVGAPAALVLFSPWIDLKMSADPNLTPNGDAMLRRSWLGACARHYLAGKDATAPFASPIYGDLRGLPPTLIQVGADDLLRHDAERIYDALRNAGVAVRCDIVPDLWHAFQLHAGMLPSADAAIERAVNFIAGSLAS
jgi:acetyl esterase/lipase